MGTCRCGSKVIKVPTAKVRATKVPPTKVPPKKGKVDKNLRVSKVKPPTTKGTPCKCSGF